MNYSNTIHGGHKKDHPQCTKRKFDDKRRKREITITVTRYVPYPHYWVTLREEDDMWADPVEKCWRSFWDEDTKGMSGFIHSFECPTISAAKAVIRRVKKLKKFKNHKFVDQATRDLKWYYRDGD